MSWKFPAAQARVSSQRGRASSGQHNSPASPTTNNGLYRDFESGPGGSLGNCRSHLGSPSDTPVRLWWPMLAFGLRRLVLVDLATSVFDCVDHTFQKYWEN